MRDVFDCWPQIAARLRTARSIALFLDFDGTLARLRLRPEEVRLDDSTRRAIARLARNPRVRICVISGRRLGDVRDRIRLPRIRYLGLHGWEGRPVAPLAAETVRALERVKRGLAGQIEDLPGIRIEDKGPVFTVHYRGASNPQISRARASLRDWMSAGANGLRMMEGKKVWEILPHAIGDKGKAVQRELNLCGSPVLPVYVGDDITDESAFAALSSGVTIRVGRRSLTRARFRLRDSDEVHRFLVRMEAEIVG